MIRRGIPNYGNTCFMNSALQFLYDIDDFKDFILNKENDNLQFIFRFISGNLNVNNIEINIKSFWGNRFHIKQQDDAHTFLDYIIDKYLITNLPTENYKSEYLSLVYKPLGNIELQIYKTILFYITRNKYKVIHKYDGSILNLSSINYFKNPRYELLTSLTLSQSEIKNIDKSINNKIKNFKIEKKNNKVFIDCSINREIIKIKKQPSNYNIFIEKIIRIPNDNKYLIILIRPNNKKPHQQKMIINNFVEIDNKKYKLFSAILHNGAIGGGHYIYALYNNNKPLYYNDSSVGLTNSSNMTFEYNAYILLYKKCDIIKLQKNKPINISDLLHNIDNKIDKIQKILLL
jgi:ubiquitin C-terminal hydrolase